MLGAGRSGAVAVARRPDGRPRPGTGRHAARAARRDDLLRRVLCLAESHRGRLHRLRGLICTTHPLNEGVRGVPTWPENAKISPIQSFTIFAGTAGNDSIVGSYLADTIAGGAGNDTLIGYGGNDWLDGDTGDDTIRSSIDYTLRGYFENLILTGTAINGTGNINANVLTGNDGANVLAGMDGNDTLYGGLGNNSLAGGRGDDLFIFNRGDGQDLLGMNTDLFLAND
ncbi:MAG: hypothetical protein KAX42_10335, partial [Sphaerotilus sp.]|nr:hypothetical protein [Sphaerotilus sp.]